MSGRPDNAVRDVAILAEKCYRHNMKIVAIGGGENGRPGHVYETKEIDEEIVKMAGKKNPALLFIGFASGSISYGEVMANIYKPLGCDCTQLYESELGDTTLTKSKIEKADIIYVGGGNTLRLMKMFRKYGIDKLLKTAGEKGTVLCGVSAGAICWCKYGQSDFRKFQSGSDRFGRVTGLGFINALFSPHYDDAKRQKDLPLMMKTNNNLVALAFDNCTALKIIDEKYEVIKSNKNASAQKLFWNKNNFEAEYLISGSIANLTKKRSHKTSLSTLSGSDEWS